jgi:hypothetical protein
MFGTVCGGIASIISIYSIVRHVTTDYKSADIKSCIVKMIAFVAVYSIDSVGGLWLAGQDQIKFYKLDNVDLTDNLTYIRELYEAYVVVAFVSLVLECMGGWKSVQTVLETPDLSLKPSRSLNLDDELLDPKDKERVELWKQTHGYPYPKHPLVFGGSIVGECSLFKRLFRRVYRPGVTQLVTMFMGILQFAWVLFFVTLVSLLLLDFVPDTSPGVAPHWVSLFIQIGKKVKIVSTTIAMYQIFMLDEMLTGSTQLKEKYEEMQPHLKFIFFKFRLSAACGLKEFLRVSFSR